MPQPNEETITVYETLVARDAAAEVYGELLKAGLLTKSDLYVQFAVQGTSIQVEMHSRQPGGCIYIESRLLPNLRTQWTKATRQKTDQVDSTCMYMHRDSAVDPRQSLNEIGEIVAAWFQSEISQLSGDECVLLIATVAPGRVPLVFAMGAGSVCSALAEALAHEPLSRLRPL